jgi:hypothetical protein
MDDHTLLPFSLPAVRRKKVNVAFDGGALSSDGGVLVLRDAERCPGVAERLAACLTDRRRSTRSIDFGRSNPPSGGYSRSLQKRQDRVTKLASMCGRCFAGAVVKPRIDVAAALVAAMPNAMMANNVAYRGTRAMS